MRSSRRPAAVPTCSCAGYFITWTARTRDGATQRDDELLPDIRFLLYLYQRKEALVSSQIEGTQSSFADLLLFENEAKPHVPVEDVEEVSNDVAALQHGLRRLKDRFPCRYA